MQDLLKPLSAYQELYKMQQQLAEQSAPYAPKPQLSREERLALQNMASDERTVSEGLEQIVEKLRAAAEKAKDVYPEAAKDAQNIADAIDAAQLSSLAGLTAREMLVGGGDKSHDLAEHTRGDGEAHGRVQGLQRRHGRGDGAAAQPQALHVGEKFFLADGDVAKVRL